MGIKIHSSYERKKIGTNTLKLFQPSCDVTYQSVCSLFDLRNAKPTIFAKKFAGMSARRARFYCIFDGCRSKSLTTETCNFLIESNDTCELTQVRIACFNIVLSRRRLWARMLVCACSIANQRLLLAYANSKMSWSAAPQHNAKNCGLGDWWMLSLAI